MRDWLRTVDQLDDAEIQESFHKVQEALARAVHGTPGRAVRFAITRAAGVIPDGGLTGTALGALDSFLVDEVIREPGPTPFSARRGRACSPAPDRRVLRIRASLGSAWGLVRPGLRRYTRVMSSPQSLGLCRDLTGQDLSRVDPAAHGSALVMKASRYESGRRLQRAVPADRAPSASRRFVPGSRSGRRNLSGPTARQPPNESRRGSHGSLPGLH